MVSDVLGTLLQELGQALQMNNLQPDSNNTCLIKFKGGIFVQIELDPTGQFMIIGSDLDVVPAGRYRENLFGEALKANGLPHPQYGIFSFSRQTNHLVLFEMLSLNELTGQKVADFLKPFLEKVRIWKEAISKGEIPVVVSARTSKAGMFGIRP